MNELSLPDLLIVIHEKKEMYKAGKRIMTKRERKALKRDTNSLINDYNKKVKFKAISLI